MKNLIKRIICLCVFVILCTACAMISYAETLENDVYVYFTDGGKTLHFTSKMNKGVSIETKREDNLAWWSDRFDLFEKEIYTDKKGNEKSKIKMDNVIKVVIDDKIKPNSCCALFSFPNINKIDKLKNLDVSECEDFREMFLGTKLKKINMNDIDFKKSEKNKNFSCMFYGCTELVEVDFSKVSLRSVISMDAMFYGCEKLSKISFNKKLYIGDKLTNISQMFEGCKSLKEVTLTPEFERVEDASYCFEDCENLESVSFDWSINCNNTSHMFENCKKLKKIDISKLIDCRYIKNMSNMFNGCSSLEEVVVEHDNYDQLEDIKEMFAKCDKLSAIYWENEKHTPEEYILNLIEVALWEYNIQNFIDVDYTFDNSINPIEANVNIKPKNNGDFFNDVQIGIAVKMSRFGTIDDKYEIINPIGKYIKLFSDGTGSGSYYNVGIGNKYTNDYKIGHATGKVIRKSLLD